MHQLPDIGFLRLHQIIGKEEITETQAKANHERNRKAEAKARQAGRLDKHGNPIYPRCPTRPRPASPGVIPVKKTAWWAGVKSGRYPPPLKLSPRVTVWRVEDIRRLIESA